MFTTLHSLRWHSVSTMFDIHIVCAWFFMIYLRNVTSSMLPAVTIHLRACEFHWNDVKYDMNKIYYTIESILVVSSK